MSPLTRPMALLALLLLANPAAAAPPDVDVEEHLGQSLPSQLRFTDENGASVQLGDYFHGAQPIVLVLAYFRCPLLCDLVLHSAADGLRAIGWRPGTDYRAITISIDPGDTAKRAGRKQAAVLQAIGQPEARAAWPFLVGDPSSIARLADRLGYRYASDPRSDQFAHPAVVVLLTPDGHIARYLYGVPFAPKDLQLGLAEAGQGRSGPTRDRVLLSCYRWDPTARRYGLQIGRLLKGTGLLLLALLTGGLAILWRRDRATRGVT